MPEATEVASLGLTTMQPGQSALATSAGFKHKLMALGHPALVRVVGSPVDLEQEPPADYTNMSTNKNGEWEISPFGLGKGS